MTTTDTTGWIAYPLRLKFLFGVTAALSLLGGFAISYRAFEQSLPVALLASGLLFALIAIILFFVARPYKVSFNQATNQTKIGKEVFDNKDIVAVKAKITMNAKGEPQIDMIINAGKGTTGKVALALPYQKTRTEKELMALRQIVPTFNLPERFEGEREDVKTMGYTQALGSQDMIEVINARLNAIYPATAN